MKSERSLKEMYLITGTVMTILVIGMDPFIPSRDLGWLTLLEVFLAWVLIGVCGASSVLAAPVAMEAARQG